jgi:serine phosphatase RsbU (regulator of sigma subunit)
VTTLSPAPRRGDNGADEPVLASLCIGDEQDASRARQCAREIGRLASLGPQDQIEIVAAVTELTLEVLASGVPASITFRISRGAYPALTITAEWARPASMTFEQVEAGILARLTRLFAAHSTPATTQLMLAKELPPHSAARTGELTDRVRRWLRTTPPATTSADRHSQNQDLLTVLEAMRAQRDQLRDAARALTAANRELEETNRGVVALYGELDAANSALRKTSHILQQAMLSEPPQVDGVAICVRYRPAGARDGAEAGGDWHDVFRLSNGDTAVIVGDVVGHDTKAAATMGQLRAMLRGLAHHTNDPPHRTLESLDRLVRTLRVTPFATSIYARLHTGSVSEDSTGVVMSWANAGHPGLIVVRPDGTSRLVELPREAALGVADGVARTVCRRWFPMGSTILMFSDGLYERRDEDVDVSIAALLERATASSGLPLVELCDTLVDSAPDEDDLVLVALRLGTSPEL